MARKYICTGYGIDKTTGCRYSAIAPIFEGNTKDGRIFGMIQNDQRQTTDEELAIGEIKSFSLISE